MEQKRQLLLHPFGHKKLSLRQIPQPGYWRSFHPPSIGFHTFPIYKRLKIKVNGLSAQHGYEDQTTRH